MPAAYLEIDTYYSAKAGALPGGDPRVDETKFARRIPQPVLQFTIGRKKFSPIRRAQNAYLSIGGIVSQISIWTRGD
jgi:hypothetical protein